MKSPFEDMNFRPARVSDQVRDALKEAIREGQIMIGSSLPKAEVLASRFGVSKVTIREALRELEADGLIEQRRGAKGGIFVTEPRSDRFKDCILDLYDFGSLEPKAWVDLRQALEPGVAALAAANRTEADIRLMTENVENCRRLLEEGRPQMDLHLEFHRLLATAAGNPMITAIMDGVIQVFSDVWKAVSPVPNELLWGDLRINEELMQCLHYQDQARARRVMTEHFQLTMSYLATRQPGTGQTVVT